MKVSQITSTGVFSTGLNKNKPFLRVIVEGKGQNVIVSENASKVAPSKGYCFINTLTAKDLYPTNSKDSKGNTLDSTNVYPVGSKNEGKPIWTNGEKLTVEEYFTRRGLETRNLHSFAGFPTDEECKLIAAQRVATMKFA